MSNAIVTMGQAAMKANDDARALLDALRAILPYAESRAEDMDNCADESECAPSRGDADKAIAAVDAAKALLASLDGSTDAEGAANG